MVKVVSIIPTISFFLIFREIDCFDLMPTNYGKKVLKQSKEVQSNVDTLVTTIHQGIEANSKVTDETTHIAVQSLSDSVTQLGDRLQECLGGRDDHLISLSARLENFQGNSNSNPNNLASVWVTIQIFSGVGIASVLCTAAAIGYMLYQRSLIIQLLNKPQSCSNCTRLATSAFEQVLNISTAHSPPHTSTELPDRCQAESPNELSQVVVDSGLPRSV